MFDFFEKTEQEKPVYYTAYKMFARHSTHARSKSSFSSLVTNAWMTAQLTNDTKFLLDEGAVFQSTLNEEKRQANLSKGQKDFSAFETTGTAYEVKELEREDLVDAGKLESQLKDSRYALISHPTKIYGDKHQEGFSKKGSTCQFFDSKYPGGGYAGPCKEVYAQLAKIIEKNYPKEASVSTLAKA